MAETNKTTKRAHRPKTAERGAKVHSRRNTTTAVKETAETRYQRIEQLALEAETRRTDLLAVAAHDLRNPLGVVLVTTAMLSREMTGPHQAEQLAAIRRAALEMTQVIEDLVDGASIDAGTLDLVREECDVLDIMQEAVAAARAVAQERSVTVEARIAQDLPLLDVDRHRVLHVFSRVVNNALRFMPKSGAITMEAAREGHAVRFSVTDTGPAVPESQRPYAFSRRPPPGRRTCRGTGLGMFVVKGIVEAHGGRVELTSDPACGNTVAFTLPL